MRNFLTILKAENQDGEKAACGKSARNYTGVNPTLKCIEEAIHNKKGNYSANQGSEEYDRCPCPAEQRYNLFLDQGMVCLIFIAVFRRLILLTLIKFFEILRIGLGKIGLALIITILFPANEAV